MFPFLPLSSHDTEDREPRLTADKHRGSVRREALLRIVEVALNGVEILVSGTARVRLKR